MARPGVSYGRVQPVAPQETKGGGVIILRDLRLYRHCTVLHFPVLSAFLKARLLK